MTKKRGVTEQGREVIMIESSSNENGWISIDGYFSESGVLYSIGVVSKEKEKTGAVGLLKEIVEKYG